MREGRCYIISEKNKKIKEFGLGQDDNYQLKLILSWK